jgi:uncharacterized damage-inducible protein DinB
MPTVEEVAKQSREQKLARMTRTADDYAAAIRGQSDPVLARRPDAKNWAVKEIICHLRDTEEGFMTRFETILAMVDPKFLAINPDRWAEERQYLRNDAGEALAAFRKRRDETLVFLKTLTAEQWQRGGVHPVRGRMTFDDFLTLIAWHDDNHLDQLNRALQGKA